MERRKFLKTCGYSALGIPVLAAGLSSCGSIYYAKVATEENRLVVAKSEFVEIRKEKERKRKFVLIENDRLKFPVCIYRIENDKYISSLLECTHSGCELNVGGGIYSCPCHGSEFSNTGKLLEGPAETDLKTFKTETDNENIYVYIS